MLTDNTNDIGHHLTVLQLTVVFQFYPVHPSTPMKDQDTEFLLTTSIQYIKQTSDENKEKYQLGIIVIDPITNSQN